MSKKYSKWLVGAALLGAAAGAGLAYLKKHKKKKKLGGLISKISRMISKIDDLEDLDGEDASDSREYVTIPSFFCAGRSRRKCNGNNRSCL